jgi:hypothetical protein
MNKTILFTLIEKEINELETLVKGMKEIDTLSPTLLSLAKSKATAILEDFDQITHLTGTEQLETFEAPQHKTEKVELIAPAAETKHEVPEMPHVDQINHVHIPHATEEHHETSVVQPSAPQKPIEEKENTTKGSATSLAETLNTAKQSLNEAIALQAEASLAETMQNSKVNDLRQAFSIADRFRFQRELFGGNGEKFNTTLSQLTASKNKEEAMALLKPLGWDENDPRVADFIRIVLRKFSEN